MVLGSTWRKMTRRSLAPWARAASTNSMDLTLSTEPRLRRAYVAQPRMPMAMKTFTKPGPSTVMMSSTNRMYGKAKKMSAVRMMTESTAAAVVARRSAPG